MMAIELALAVTVTCLFACTIVYTTLALIIITVIRSNNCMYCKHYIIMNGWVCEVDSFTAEGIERVLSKLLGLYTTQLSY